MLGISSWEQGIQSLDPLLEMPFIDLDESSKASVTASLNTLSAALTNKEVTPKEVAEHTDRLMRNASLSAGNNPMLREPEPAPLNHLTAILETFRTYDRRRSYFPRFLDKSTKKPELTEEEKTLLCDVPQFIADYTQQGHVYHGTASEHLFSIVRNAFIISEGVGAGGGAYGPGVYASNKFYVADDYANNGDGSLFVLALNQETDLRIFSWNALHDNPEKRALVERLASDKGYIELESDHKVGGIYKYLNTELGVDVVQNMHTVILNLDAIMIPKTMAQFLEKISAYRNQLLVSASFNPKLLPAITDQCKSLERMALDLGAISTDEITHVYPKLG